MSNGFNEILVQTGYYAVTMILTVGLIGILLKGFFWKFIKVRLSFGKYVMVKIRAVNRDHYAVGRINEGDLVYMAGKYEEKRLNIADNSVFYRSLGLIWVDVDEMLNCIIKPDMDIIEGFDAVKYNNLYVRALTRPSIADNKDRMMLGIALLLAVLIIGIGFLVYKQGVQLEDIARAVGSLNKGMMVAGG
jgi:hypothetical protein